MGTLIAVAAGMIAYTTYTTTALNKKAAATAQLANIQESYKGLVDSQEAIEKLREDFSAATEEDKKKTLSESIEKQTKELGEVRTKLSLTIDSLDSPEPFDTLSQLYRGLLAGRFKDFEAVQRALSALPDWQRLRDKNGQSSKRFVAETAALGLSKALAQSDAKAQVAKDNLKTLAEKGSFVAVEAAGAFAALAATPEEKANAKQLIDGVRARFPGQDKYLSDVAQRLR